MDTDPRFYTLFPSLPYGQSIMHWRFNTSVVSAGSPLEPGAPKDTDACQARPYFPFAQAESHLDSKSFPMDLHVANDDPKYWGARLVTGTKRLPKKRVPRTAEERKIYRNNYRKQAEKTRREMMKASFQGIKEVLPPNRFSESKPPEECILDAACDYISELEEGERVKLERLEEMEKEIKLCKLLLGI
ncbi:hypothetical protein HDU98_004242 [Podochytrium sp. JEL0797]|nr:hypothetical protein HDU98_004242 [Podochytrium sp. JEL0797]